MSSDQSSPGAPAEPGEAADSVTAPSAPAAAAGAEPAWSFSGTAMEQLRAERPEVAAGAAFAGGLLVALILKRLAR